MIMGGRVYLLKFNNIAPEKMMGVEDDPASYWVSVTFQGRTDKLWESIPSENELMASLETELLESSLLFRCSVGQPGPPTLTGTPL